jgi:metal-responsive CopG/Arc/MetJ family transcriptional regulator
MTLKRVRIEMPPGMAAKLDVQAKKRGVTRQELIKVWLGDRLEKAGWGAGI